MEKYNTENKHVNPALLTALDNFLNGPFQEKFRGLTRRNLQYARAYALQRQRKLQVEGKRHRLNDRWIMKILSELGYEFQVTTDIKVKEPAQ